MPIKEAEKFAASNLFEGMTSLRSLLEAYESGYNDRKIEKVLYNEKKIAQKPKEFAFLRAMATLHGFALETTTADVIDRYAIGTSHGGVLAFCTDRTLLPLTEANLPADGFYFMLEGMEDPYNFGYSLRSLYAAGVDGIVLPPRNWMGAAGVVARASAGASEKLPLYVSDIADVIPFFKAHGYRVVCADKPNSTSLYETSLAKPLLVIVGGEKRGNSQTILEAADAIVHIDYGREFPAALSAASASAVLAFEVMRQNRKFPGKF